MGTQQSQPGLDQEHISGGDSVRPVHTGLEVEKYRTVGNANILCIQRSTRYRPYPSDW